MKNETYKTVIVEDEENDMLLLKALLKAFPEIQIVGNTDNVASGRNLILETKPDLIFLDIDLYGETGFSLLDKLKDYQLNFRVVFTTAHKKYAIKAFNYNTFDYLLKPIDTDALERVIKKFTNEKKDNHLSIFNDSFHKVIIEQSGRDIYIDADDILYLKAVKGETYTEVYTSKSDKPLIVSKGIGEFEKKILAGNFMKVHRSFTINLKYISEINSTKGFIYLGDTKIKVSTKKAAQLRKFLRDQQ